MVKKKHPTNWVRHYRTEAGLTSEALAEKVGLSPVGLRYIEKSERILTLENAKKIADALSVHYIDIIEGPTDTIRPINDEEIEMLKKFRQMDEKDQDRFIHMAEMFAMENEKNKS